MKKIVFISIAAIALSACNSQSSPKSENTSTLSSQDNSSKKTAIYQCPMDEDITSDKPGKCSKCGMDLELKK